VKKMKAYSYSFRHVYQQNLKKDKLNLLENSSYSRTKLICHCQKLCRTTFLLIHLQHAKQTKTKTIFKHVHAKLKKTSNPTWSPKLSNKYVVEIGQ